jgi:hypothetical protein
MAITRAQQAKQMLQDGGRIGLKKGTDRQSYSARQTSGGPKRSTYSSEIEDEIVTRGDTEDRRETQKEREELGFVPTGGESEDQSTVAKRQKKKYEQQFYDEGKVPPLGSRPTSFKQRLDQRNKQKRLNYINYLQRQINKKLQAGLMDPSIPGVDVMTEEELLDLAPSVQDLVAKGFYSKDGRFAKGDIPDFPTTDLPGVLGIAQDIFAGPVTSDKLKQLNEQLKTLEGLKTTEGLEGTTFNELMETYEPNRFKLENTQPDSRDDGPSDPCLGPNPPAYCFIGDKADETQEDVITRNLAGLTPRIGGSMFDFTGMADGGLAAMDREAFLLGGIAKGLKKAVRGVKKIAKSPLGKAALIGAGFGLAGMGPFKGLAGTSFGKGLAGLRGTLFGQAGSRVSEAFIPYKEGLFTKLGLTKGGGSLIPTFKGGITLASILPLLVGKTDEEKDDILKDYYAQKLEPGTTARQAGSEFDFYNYNLAEGGTPRKEPVAKKVMPLLDMGGMEKDYRAEGGFVPIGRMEKADDVPARLSKNEFVFTADAVRNAGDGDVDKGAEVMYNMMKNLEAGGDVSEESQGLDGAREMFQTSQRLGEVI